VADQRHRVKIAPLTTEHADAVLAIYQQGLDGGNASFETTAPSWDAFDRARRRDLRFVALDDGEVLGWVVCSAVSARAVYAGVVEHSIFVAPAAQGRGVGRALLDALLTAAPRAGVWTVQSSVFPENTASLALHRAAGFRTVGTRERIGQHLGRWRDTVLIEWRAP